jgi:mannan endo-1,4-beta-mannosidase
MMMAMKSYALAALSAASTLAAVVQPAPRSSSFVTISGSHFDIDGDAGYFAGTNCYWCPFTYNTAEVDTTLSDIASSGLKVVRVLGFSDWNTLPPTGEIWFQLLNATGSIINTGADGLQNLDYVVASAEQHGLKLIIPFVNNWNDFGGINAYVNAFGGNATSWFTNAAAQSQYRTYIHAVVSRYINSTAIFAWELANEPRCAGCDTSVIADWATGVSQYIKSLDPNHLVTLGDEGLGLSTGDGSYPYTYDSGTDFALNIQIKSLDFGTFHLYPDGCKLHVLFSPFSLFLKRAVNIDAHLGGETYPWGSSWVQTHAQACVEAGKICIMEECKLLLPGIFAG